MSTLALATGFLSLGLTLLLPLRLRAPLGFMLWGGKILAGALSPAILLMALISIALGLLSGSTAAVVSGALSVALGARSFLRVTAAPDAEGPFASSSPRLMKTRWSWRLEDSPEGRWTRDLPFSTIPGSDRKLLCDVWEPPAGTPRSGVAILYFHGSGWYVFDKDFGTRAIFRHLAAQGHVVMDVAYRLFPETDIEGMVGDVRRAIAWMKRNAERFGVDPDRIVLSGGSAGGHLSLLAGFTPGHPKLTPEELRGEDTSVAGIASFYGPADLRACFEHTNQSKLPPPKVSDPKQPAPAWARWLFGGAWERLALVNAPIAGALTPVLGGSPKERPERYALLSPSTHVSPNCPPTLLVQGEHDLITPIAATRELHRKLVDAGVISSSVVLPETDHGFDLFLPTYSPPAQVALYEFERFLAWIAERPRTHERARAA